MTDTDTVVIHHQVWVREGEGFVRQLCDGGADTVREVIEVNGGAGESDKRGVPLTWCLAGGTRSAASARNAGPGTPAARRGPRSSSSRPNASRGAPSEEGGGLRLAGRARLFPG